MTPGSSAARRNFLHSLLGAGTALAGHTALASLLGGCTARTPQRPALDWTLRPARDPATGLDLLELPEGFRYFSFGWAGQALDDGVICPPAHDGMGVVAHAGDLVTLVRNQEQWSDGGAFGFPERAWDPAASGGTTTLQLDLRAERMVAARSSLTGTCANCSGGVTPWGSWLSGEEFAVGEQEAAAGRAGSGPTAFQRQHGFVFEVPAAGFSDSQPLADLGQFRHEAVAVDPDSGILYETEDHVPHSGFYRFVPNRAGELRGGGKLQMLQAVGAPDLRGGVAAGSRYAVKWIDIDEPTRVHRPGTIDQAGVVDQGLQRGATSFLRLEGLVLRGKEVWFTSTAGGAAGAGQLWLYRSDRETLELVYESPDPALVDYPDQLALLGGGMVICQDSKRVAQQALFWLAPGGAMRTLARNNVVWQGQDYRTAEWSGVCTSPDGKWLFANIYMPGFSVAITGPWEQLA